MLRYTDITGLEVDKVANAIRILKSFEPKDEPYIVLYSGGKDSDCILQLAKMSGVKFEAHYSATTVDPKELVRHIIHEHPEVIINKPQTSMRKLIPQKLMPPTRRVRYCCEELKEQAHKGRLCVSGVRWAQSIARKQNQGTITVFNVGKKAEQIANDNGAEYKRTKRGGIIMNTDNAEERRTVEHCFRTGRVLVNPIIDWEEQDVWQFIKQRNIKYCSLYDLGFKRLGCVGCPMATQSEKIKQLEQNPGIKKMYLAAFTEMLKQRERRGLQTKLWKTADDVMQWWIYENKSIDQIDGQMDILEQLEEYEQ